METLSVAEIAEILSVSEESVRRWIREGKLNADKKQGRTGHTIYLEDLVEFVNQPPHGYVEKLRQWLTIKGIPHAYMPGRTRMEAVMAGAAMGSVAAGLVGSIAGGLVGYKAGTSKPIIVLNDVLEAETPENGVISCEFQEVPQDLGCAEGPEVSAQKPRDVLSGGGKKKEAELMEKIRKKQMEIIRLEQELMRLEAEINIAKNEIRYYELEIASCETERKSDES